MDQLPAGGFFYIMEVPYAENKYDNYTIKLAGPSLVVYFRYNLFNTDPQPVYLFFILQLFGLPGVFFI
jgi:hypothetical protein